MNFQDFQDIFIIVHLSQKLFEHFILKKIGFHFLAFLALQTIPSFFPRWVKTSEPCWCVHGVFFLTVKLCKRILETRFIILLWNEFIQEHFGENRQKKLSLIWEKIVKKRLLLFRNLCNGQEAGKGDRIGRRVNAFHISFTIIRDLLSC